MKSKILKVSRELYQEILNSCITIADFCRALNLAPKGGNYRKVKDLIVLYNLDDSKLLGIHWKLGKKVYGTPHRKIKDILVKDSPYKTTIHLKNLLFKYNIKLPRCELCGYTEKVELHHINGNARDNRIENLQILCPNCHSKTNNFRGKNISYRQFTPCQETILSKEEAEQRYLEKLEKRRVKSKKPSIELQDLECLFCHKIFHSKRHQKYCSLECYQNDTKGNRPTLLQLLNDFKELKSFVLVGNKYNVTDNAVRKWCKLYGLPILTSGMKIYINTIIK